MTTRHGGSQAKRKRTTSMRGPKGLGKASKAFKSHIDSIQKTIQKPDMCRDVLWRFFGGSLDHHEPFFFRVCELIFPIRSASRGIGGWLQWKIFHIWGFPGIWVAQNGWFINVYNGKCHEIRWFGGTPISGNLHIFLDLDQYSDMKLQMNWWANHLSWWHGEILFIMA